MEKGIKIFIVEDEIITAASIQKILEEAGYDVVGIADNADDALKEILVSLPDFVILDIHLLGKKNGIWLAEEINKRLNIPFAFITGQGDKDSIHQAVKTRPYGYLIKPFQPGDIYDCIENALNNFAQQKTGEAPPQDKTTSTDSMVIKNTLFIKTGNLYVKIVFDDILFFESDKNYVDIYTEGKKFTSRNALKEIARNIPADQFIQINRSIIVNLKNIDAISTSSVHIRQHELTLSENYKQELLNRLKFLDH